MFRKSIRKQQKRAQLAVSLPTGLQTTSALDKLTIDECVNPSIR
jgi:hypothetical protein